jgi:hypothetical protein
MRFNAAINNTPHIYSPTVFNMVNVPRIIVKTAIAALNLRSGINFTLFAQSGTENTAPRTIHGVNDQFVSLLPIKTESLCLMK